MSLMYHGFRLTYSRKDLKKRKGYVIPSTRREDASGTDLWIKMPGDARILPVQVTQRGVGHFRKYHKPDQVALLRFVQAADVRVARKRRWCHRYHIAFVLVRDFDGTLTNKTIAWGDVKALRYAVARV